MSGLKHVAAAWKWILDEGEMSPYDDPRFVHVAYHYDCKIYVTLLSYCINYRQPILLSSRHYIKDQDQFPLPLTLVARSSYPVDRLVENPYSDDPYMPYDGWVLGTLDDTRTHLCDMLGRPVYSVAEDEIPFKEVSYDS